VKLRDRRLHDESNCTLPPVAVPQADSSNEDLTCDGIEAYHLSQLDRLLCHDDAGNISWMRGNPDRGGHFGRAPLVGRFNQYGFVKRNRTGQFADSRGGMQAAGSKNNDFSCRKPKVVNGPWRGNATSVANDEDDGTYLHIQVLCSG